MRKEYTHTMKFHLKQRNMTAKIDREDNIEIDEIKDSILDMHLHPYAWKPHRAGLYQAMNKYASDCVIEYAKSLSDEQGIEVKSKEEIPMQKRYSILQNQDQKIGYTLGWADAIEWKDLKSQPIQQTEWPTKFEIEVEATRHCNDDSFQQQFRVWNEAIQWVNEYLTQRGQGGVK